MTFSKKIFLLFTVLLAACGCFRYSFSGATIPEGVNTVYIPFFPDRSNSGITSLSDQLNEALIDRFINQSRLQLANSQDDADAILDGSITTYTNRPFSVSGDEQATSNQVNISVNASFRIKSEDSPEWTKTFSGNFEYDPSEDPVNGELNAAREALLQIANTMFNDAVSNW